MVVFIPVMSRALILAGAAIAVRARGGARESSFCFASVFYSTHASAHARTHTRPHACTHTQSRSMQGRMPNTRARARALSLCFSLSLSLSLTFSRSLSLSLSFPHKHKHTRACCTCAPSQRTRCAPALRTRGRFPSRCRVYASGAHLLAVWCPGAARDAGRGAFGAAAPTPGGTGAENE